MGDVALTFDEFTRHVHSLYVPGSKESLTDLFLRILRLAKPELEKAATSRIDPRVPPYHLTLWLNFVRNEWNNYERPRTEI